MFRSYAMISASSNFSHMCASRLSSFVRPVELTKDPGSVAVDKLASHQLVKTGIYSWSRHPSYAGFTWWAVGTQVRLALISEGERGC